MAMWPFIAALGVLSLGTLACLIPLARRRERLGGMLLAPGNALRNVAEQPDWIAPFFLVLVFALLGSMAEIGKFLEGISRSGGGISGSARIIIMIIPFLMVVGILAFNLGAWVVRTGCIWLLARISGEKTRFYPLLSAVGYASLPEFLFGGIVTACVIAFGGVHLSPTFSIAPPTSLAGLSPDLIAENIPLRFLFGRIELFGLWSLVLAIIGVQRVYGCPMRKAALIGAMYWILVLGMIVGVVAIWDATQQMMG
jgi:hypothetical protein